VHRRIVAHRIRSPFDSSRHRAQLGRYVQAVGIICDYFIARDDDEALLAMTATGGPGGVDSRVADVVPLKGVLPWTDAPVLAAAAIGCRQSELGDWMSDEPLATESGGEVMLVRMPVQFQRGLASLGDDRLDAVAAEWSRESRYELDRSTLVPTSEGGSQSMADMQVEMVSDLRSLSQRAEASGAHIYCWVCV